MCHLLSKYFDDRRAPIHNANIIASIHWTEFTFDR